MEQENTLLTENQESPSIVLYTAEDNSIHLDVKLENETVWLSIEQMALLFGRDRTVVSRHIRNIYSEGELTRDITCAKFAHMGIDNDQVYEVQLYNLDVIISVGYRVKSIQGTRFRQWAKKVLRDYLVKGYAVNQKITQQRYEELINIKKPQIWNRIFNRKSKPPLHIGHPISWSRSWRKSWSRKMLSIC